MNNSRRYVPVENCLNIMDDRLWYYIPGFNGYEVSNDGYLRSMKHYRRYPYGILITPNKTDKNYQDPLFELSDNNNERCRIRLSQIMHLAFTNKFTVSGYPRRTNITDANPRNDRNFVKKKPKIPPIDNQHYHYAKFTIIQDGTETPNMIPKPDEVVVPIQSINGGEFYGRKDCRTFSHINVRTGPI